MSRPVLSLNLPAHLKTLLVQNGYLAAADFDEGQGAEDLLQFLSEAEVQAVADLARKQPVAVSAWALGQDTRRQKSFLTQLCGLDSLLGGKGIALGGGSVSEVVGQPGSGQTELCLRLCVAVQLPESLGGAGMRAVYVDTTGSFYHAGAERAATGLREQLVAARKNDLPLQLPEPGVLLDGIGVFRVYEAHELVALLESFDDVCRELSNVVLVSQAKSSDTDHATAPHSKCLPIDGDVWSRISSNHLSIGNSGSGRCIELHKSSV
ncbi:hypothetical protein LPJ66_011662, partial [Kickxella alabastrina]